MNHATQHIFLTFLTNKFLGLPSRDLLVLDEAHRIEEEVVKFTGISISRRKWRRYIPDLKVDDHGYDVSGWVGFLDKLKDMMRGVKIRSEELLVEAMQDIEKLDSTIDSISLDPSNWIVSEINREGREVASVEL
jgi:Rad3-related DNA helicase